MGLLFESQEIVNEEFSRGIDVELDVVDALVHQSLGQFLEDLLGIVNAATP